MTKTFQTVMLARDEAIATLSLNRPDKLNALNAQMIEELTKIMDALDSDPTVRVVILTGTGDKAFAAGADIPAMSEMSTAQANAFSGAGHALAARIEAAHFPVIGAINGFALGGGCEVALACDFLYASDKAKFGQPEVNLGVIPGFGGTQRLARRVGIARARELCLTGDVIDAETALRLGIVNAVVPHAELMSKVREVASKIASKGPLAIAQCKRVLLRGADVTLTTACELEAQAFASLFGTHDQREGMHAFLEKRKPAFTGS